MTLSFEQISPEPSYAGGVYQPQEDSLLLADCLRLVPQVIGGRVLDLCTGSGVLARAAAHSGAASVTAVDASELAVHHARRLCIDAPCPVRVHHGRFEDHIGRDRFDVVTCNPPYVPAPGIDDGVAISPGPRHAWDAGPTGRDVLDPLCAHASEFLEPDGTLLLVQSEFADIDATVNALRANGLDAHVMAVRWVPFGPVMTARAEWLESLGLLEKGRRTEELAVVRAIRKGAA